MLKFLHRQRRSCSHKKLLGQAFCLTLLAAFCLEAQAQEKQEMRNFLVETNLTKESIYGYTREIPIRELVSKFNEFYKRDFEAFGEPPLTEEEVRTALRAKYFISEARADGAKLDRMANRKILDKGCRLDLVGGRLASDFHVRYFQIYLNVDLDKNREKALLGGRPILLIRYRCFESKPR